MKVFSHQALLLTILFTLCLLVYLPGLQGGFVYDDYPNIIDAPAFSNPATISLGRVLEESLSSSIGRPASMASFYLSYVLAGGFDAVSFKATGVAIHLFNGFLLYLLATRLLHVTFRDENRSRKYALVITAIWLLHPLHISTVLYVVQRMTLLATSFMLLGLLAYVIARERIANQRQGAHIFLVVSLLCMPAAILFKEIGALQGLLALVLEFFILSPALPTKRRNAVHLYFGLSVYLPFTAILIGLLSGNLPGLINYGGRPFTLIERLMTESRVVLEYMQWILVPNIQQYGLFHDDFRLSTGLLSPPSTIMSIAALSVVTMVAWISRHRWPMFAGGTFFFLIGLSLESTVLPLLIAFEHRNYLPSFGILFALVSIAQLLPSKLRTHRMSPWFLIVLVFVLSFATLTRAMIWGNPIAHAQSEVANHPDSTLAHNQVAISLMQIAASPSITKFQAQGYAAEALEHINKASELSPESPIYKLGALWVRSQHLTTPDRSEFQSVAAHLEQSTYNMPVGGYLVGITDCTYRNHCKIGNDELRLLVTSALRNPKLVGLSRASAFTALAAIENQSGNIDKAISALESATKTSTNTPFELTLANYLTDLGYNGRAAEIINRVRQSDDNGAYENDLEQIEQELKSGN